MFGFFIPIFLCFVISVMSQPDFLYNVCGNSGNYTTNSTYQTNLNDLFTALTSDTQIDYGFYNFSSDGNSDRAHAIALCRGDVTPADCRRCLNDSTIKITQSCPNNKEAIGWYDNCMLRYSNNSNIFGTYTDRPAFYMQNTQNVTNTTQFGVALGELMVNLSSKALSGDSRRKFATGKVSLTNLEKIYGLVQCTPDMSSLDCSTCIADSINGIQATTAPPPSTSTHSPSPSPPSPSPSPSPSLPPPPPPPPSPSPSPSSPPLPTETIVQTNTTNSSGSKCNNMSRTIIIGVVSLVTYVVFFNF